jgi:hypothetical protein
MKRLQAVRIHELGPVEVSYTKVHCRSMRLTGASRKDCRQSSGLTKGLQAVRPHEARPRASQLHEGALQEHAAYRGLTKGLQAVRTHETRPSGSQLHEGESLNQIWEFWETTMDGETMSTITRPPS